METKSTPAQTANKNQNTTAIVSGKTGANCSLEKIEDYLQFMNHAGGTRFYILGLRKLEQVQPF